jgi:protein-S-isoprenylcysteine O-methyltransferase Ste14
MEGKQVLPPTYLLVSIVTMVALHFLLPVTTIIPLLWNILGIIPLALGVVINIIADNALHKVKTTVKPFEEPSVLVTDGVFRISRNPMYLGFAFILMGVAVLMGSITPYVVIPLFVVLMDRIFVQAEEQTLAEKFGAAWLEYTEKTRRWM